MLYLDNKKKLLKKAQRIEAIGMESLGFCHLGTGYVEKEVTIKSGIFFRCSDFEIVQ